MQFIMCQLYLNKEILKNHWVHISISNSDMRYHRILSQLPTFHICIFLLSYWKLVSKKIRICTHYSVLQHTHTHVRVHAMRTRIHTHTHTHTQCLDDIFPAITRENQRSNFQSLYLLCLRREGWSINIY